MVSLFSLVTIAENFTDFYEKPFPVSSTASNLATDIQAFGKNIGYSIMTDDKQQTAQYVQDARDKIASMKEDVEFMSKNFSNPALVDKFDQTMKSVTDLREQVLDLALENRNDEAASLYFEEVMPALIESSNILNQISAEATADAGNGYQASMTRKTNVMFILLTLSVIVLAITIFLSLYITRSLTRPIKELETATQIMAQGNLKIDVQYVSKDELGSLAENMRVMSDKVHYYMSELSSAMQQLASGDLNVKKREDFMGDFAPVQMAIRTLIVSLNDSLSQINQSADQVANGSDQVSSGSQALSQGVTEQAASISQVTQGIDQISSVVQTNSATAEESAAASEELSGQAQILKSLVGRFKLKGVDDTKVLIK